MDTEPATALIAKGLNVAREVLSQYDSFISSFVPGNEFQKSLDALEKYRNDYAGKIDWEINGIYKPQIMNYIDAFFYASQKIREWADIIESHLQLVNKLFDEHDARKAESQKQLLVEVLDNGVAQINAAQTHLVNSLPNLLAADRIILASRNVFIEKWKVYHAKLRKPIHFLGAYRSRDKKYIAANVNKIKAIIKIYSDLLGTVKRAAQTILRGDNILRTQATAIADLKKQMQSMALFGNVVERLDLRDQIIESAQLVIENSQEFRKKHANVDLNSQ